MAKLFKLKTWHSGTIKISAIDLRNRVKDDSRRDYNWIAAASDLVKTCESKDFPEDVAAEIKDLILGCFANLAIKKVYSDGSVQKDNDEKAVWKCYKDSKDQGLRQRFIKETVKAAILLEYGDDGVLFHSGQKHAEFEKKFIEKMLEDVSRKERYAYGEDAPDNLLVDYITWRKSLRKRFNTEYKKADEDGFFDSDQEWKYDVSKAIKNFKLVNHDFKEISPND